MSKRMVRSLVPWLMTIIFVAPTVAMAGGFLAIVPTDCAGSNAATACSICDFAELAQNILNDAIYLAVVICAILFARGGFIYLTAGGGSEVTRAKSILTNIFIGLIIILAAWLIVDTLMKTLTGGSFGPWNSVCSASAVGSTAGNEP